MPDYPQITKAGRWDIAIQQGSTFIRNIVFEDIDVSEFEFRGMIKKDTKQRVPLADWNITIISNNEIECSLTHEQTAFLPAEPLVHDIEMFDMSANTVVWVARILSGRVKVSAEVTK